MRKEAAIISLLLSFPPLAESRGGLDPQLWGQERKLPVEGGRASHQPWITDFRRNKKPSF
jgi:hypothetical protein